MTEVNELVSELALQSPKDAIIDIMQRIVRGTLSIQSATSAMKQLSGMDTRVARIMRLLVAGSAGGEGGLQLEDVAWFLVHLQDDAPIGGEDAHHRS